MFCSLQQTACAMLCRPRILVFVLSLCILPTEGSLPAYGHYRRSSNYWYFQKVASSNFTFRGLFYMLQKKSSLLRTLNTRISSIQSNPTPEEKIKMEVLKLYERELRASEKSLVAVLQDLNQTLSSDYQSLENIKHSCQMRMSDVREAAVLVEEDYNAILYLEKEMSLLHPNINSTLQIHNHVINDILAEISHAADNLEHALQKEDIFSDSKRMEGAAFETVVKLSEGAFPEDHRLMNLQKRLQEEKEEEERGNEASDRGISMLIDSLSNQYILSRPRDITVPIEDHRLIHDIVNLLLLSFILSVVCLLLKIPSLFGYIFAGILLGPVGHNAISSVVQVETIGEFGVIFIVFMIGLDFSADKLRKVWNVSVYGGNLLLAASIVLAILLGLPLNVHPKHSLFVAACLFLSSSPLAVKFIDGTSLPTKLTHNRHASDADLTRTVSPLEDPELDISTSLVGILVMQDVQLGILMAVMPFFMEGEVHSAKSSWAIPSGVLHLVQVMLGFTFLLLTTRGLTTRKLDRFYRLFGSIFHKQENVLLGAVAACCCLLLVAEMVGASLQLGCFLAGIAISSQGHAVDQVKRVVEPVRDFFAVFFFASLGFHVFPTFLWSEFSMIFFVTICVILLKFCLAVCVLGFFLGHCRSATLTLAFSLAQVSEFSFVLASRARRLDIIAREVYLVILSVAALSLLLSPLLWRLFLVGVALRQSTFRLSMLSLPRPIMASLSRLLRRHDITSQ